MPFMTRIFLILLLCLGVRGAIAAANDGAVGMVLDLKGSGELVDKGRTTKLQLLSYLQPQMQLKLTAGSKASLSLYATRSVYQLVGPAVVEIGKDKLTMVQGDAPQIKSMSEKLVAAAETSNILPGAFRMRNLNTLKLVTPQKGSILLDSTPMLSWESTEDPSFEISIVQQPGTVVYKTKVNDTSLQIPPGVKLESGKNYQWTVAYTSAADGKQVTETSDFRVASKADLEMFAALKPAEGAPIEEWVLYAATLQSRQISEEARKVWRMIAQQRPDLLKAQELAR